MKKLVTALFLILATTVWAGDFEDVVAAYNQGDYKLALSLKDIFGTGERVASEVIQTIATSLKRMG